MIMYYSNDEFPGRTPNWNMIKRKRYDQGFPSEGTSKRLKHKYPAYRDCNIREMSFADSTGFLKKGSSEYAINGFFYKGYSTICVCFHCGVEKAMTENDDPLEEHQKLSSNCEWLKENMQMLGKDTAAKNAAMEVSTAMETEPTESSDSTQLDTATAARNLELQKSHATCHTTREAEELMRALQCKVCLDKTLSVTFQPCGHTATCHACAQRLNTCPICRKYITQKLKVIFS